MQEKVLALPETMALLPLFSEAEKVRNFQLSAEKLLWSYAVFHNICQCDSFSQAASERKGWETEQAGNLWEPPAFDPFYSSSYPSSWLNAASLPGINKYSTSWVFCPHLCSFQANSSRERLVLFTHPWQQKDKSVQNSAVSSFSFLPPQTGAQWSSLRKWHHHMCAFKKNLSQGSQWFMWLLIHREYSMAPVICGTQLDHMVLCPFLLAEFPFPRGSGLGSDKRELTQVWQQLWVSHGLWKWTGPCTPKPVLLENVSQSI